jgi:hypothetical protein
MTIVKWTEVGTQTIEWLLCKWEALSSNISPTKEKKERKEKQPQRKYTLAIKKKNSLATYFP